MRTWLAIASIAAITLGGVRAEDELPWPAGCDQRDMKARQACRVQKATAMLRDQVKSSLKDPYSAVFSEEQLYSSDDPPALALCGKINAKNSYGGYGGVGAYISTTTGLIRLERDERSAFPSLWLMFCKTPR